ncbi:MAG TPA: hypothetical protein QF901_10070 [Gammaproteobacteria bacterium]|jgi:hypothetical protein|nr:hypothetical protein [Gammaproteobacteria bacterium]
MDPGRECIDRFLEGRPDARAPFVPIIDHLAARIDAIPYAEMCAAPGAWSAALIKTARLIEADAVVTTLDMTTVERACRGDGPAATAIETLQGVVATAGPSMGCAAALPGPVSSARQLFAEEDHATALKRLKRAYGELVESVLQVRPDLVMFVEDLNDFDGIMPAGAARAYNTLRNLAAHYNVVTATYIDGYKSTELDSVAATRADVYVLGTELGGSPPALSSAVDLAQGALGAGISIALESPKIARTELEAAAEASANGCNLLITSRGPVRPEIDLEALRALIGDRRGANA